MLLEFEKKVAAFIKANELICSVDKMLLAISGGADSTALLYALRALRDRDILGVELLCAHINHQLRGAEADLDEEFVVTQAGKLKLAVITRKLEVRGFARRNKLSIETAARQLRMAGLIDIAKANNCGRIATAHQKNDNAETILQRLIRGTGFRGLGGIWPRRVFADGIEFVRPLLCVGRDEVIEYLHRRNLQWRRDDTNADCTYRRNYIRHRLLPALQEDCRDSLVERLSELAASARRFYDLICDLADKLWPNLADCDGRKTVLDLNIFLTQPQPVKVELVRRGLTAIGSGERNLTMPHYEGILQLAGQNVTGRTIELPGGFLAWREYENLIFSNRRVGLAPPISSKDQAGRMGNSFAHAALETAWAGQPAHPTIVEIPGQIKFDNFSIRAIVFEKNEVDFEEFKTAKTDSIEWFDMDKIKPPFTVRHRRPGDRFVPLGLRDEKKLGKFLTAQRIPRQVRRKVFVVTDSEKIIWIWPIRISDRVRITAQTRRILQLRITDSTGNQEDTCL